MLYNGVWRDGGRAWEKVKTNSENLVSLTTEGAVFFGKCGETGMEEINLT